MVNYRRDVYHPDLLLLPTRRSSDHFVQEEKPSGDTETYGAAGYAVPATSGNTQTGDNIAKVLALTLFALNYRHHPCPDNKTPLTHDVSILSSTNITLHTSTSSSQPP